MRVAVFRALDDGRRTAARLAEAGHTAVLAPVLRIVPTGAALPAGDALVFTSAHAPEILVTNATDLAGSRALPCWCVGARTAAAARAAGFTDVRTGPGDGHGLAAVLTAHAGPARLVLVAGRDRKPDLERALMAAGLDLVVAEAYAAEAAMAWDGSVAAALRDVAATLHYSRRSAVLAHGLARAAGLERHFLSWSHHCLSADVADALREHGVPVRAVAGCPDESALIATLDSAQA